MDDAALGNNSVHSDLTKIQRADEGDEVVLLGSGYEIQP
jgi:hypothetical protein